MKSIITVLSLILFLQHSVEGGISYHKKGSGYPFVLSKPKGYVKGQPMSLIVFLHGKSLSGDSLEKLKTYGTSLLSPKGNIFLHWWSLRKRQKAKVGCLRKSCD